MPHTLGDFFAAVIPCFVQSHGPEPHLRVLQPMGVDEATAVDGVEQAQGIEAYIAHAYTALLRRHPQSAMAVSDTARPGHASLFVSLLQSHRSRRAGCHQGT